jgi:hypothetical protein
MGANGVEAVEVGVLVDINGYRTVTVPKGEGCKQGSWFCCTHHEFMDNNLQKDFHIHKGKHVLAWVCHEHGDLEVP